MLLIITIIATLIALWQTHKQIKISNKQYLFDKRLGKYLFVKVLLELYKDNESYTDDPDDEVIIVDSQFIILTNNNYLKDITCIINDPKNNDFKNNFLVKIEELKHRHSLYDVIDDLKESYHEVVSKKVINKIEKSIKL